MVLEFNKNQNGFGMEWNRVIRMELEQNWKGREQEQNGTGIELESEWIQNGIELKLELEQN